MKRLPPSFNLPRHSEVYESFGEIRGGVHDLKPVVEEMREARRVYIGADDADLVGIFEVPFPPSIVWQYFVDPDKRLRWQTMQTSVKNQPNERGRQGVGSSSHCAHGVGGDVLREYLDWRPFRYYTHRFTPLPNGFELAPPAVETIEFFPREDGGTRFTGVGGSRIVARRRASGLRRRPQPCGRTHRLGQRGSGKP